MAVDGWLSVSRANPCPICQRHSNCVVSVDRQAAWCGRVPSERQNAGGQYFHWVGDDPRTYRTGEPPQKKSPKKSKPKAKETFLPPVKYQELAQKNYRHLKPWSKLYGVPEDCWVKIGAYAANGQLFTPEFDYQGQEIVGIARRSFRPDGTIGKFFGTGHSRGATLVVQPSRHGHATLIVEGPSCSAAGVAAGFEIIGRHTRDAPLDAYHQLLDEVPGDSEIIVLVENDKAPSDSELSDEGFTKKIFRKTCERAAKLANELGRPVKVASPPPGYGDLSDWWRGLSEGFGHLLNEDDAP